ncbi:MAG: right-handed parallel beta-helix repeat-containing protein [Planctomycetota bacterium]|nr:right-handed parallel beta-helix repeat-containing protein [Planctomycetota bacterium]
MDEKAALGYWNLRPDRARDAADGPFDPEAMERLDHGPLLRVGLDQGDLRGGSHLAIQAAVDYVAGLGGGTVLLGPGRFELRNAVTLRNRVRLAGTPGKTELVACAGLETQLVLDGDCNERRVTLAEPDGFRVGDGISIQDKRMSGGFGVTTATLTARAPDDPRAFLISTPLYYDYMVAQEASARLTFPLIGAWGARDAEVRDLSLDGNKAQAQPLNGCRGGGIYFFECERMAIRDCVVRAYQGDGISFQVSNDVRIERCRVEACAALGLHPGSGSQHPVLLDNRSIGNGGDGLFVCWRVKHGRFERNEIRANGGHGISIGHKDTDNLFMGNTIAANGGCGVLFRNESEPMGAHRNVFERNAILDNGAKEAPAAVHVLGHAHDLVFRGNVIGREVDKPGPGVGILLGPNAKHFIEEGNEFRNVSVKVQRA